VTPSRGTTQTVAVLLAFIAAALSFTAVAVTVSRTGRIEVTPLFGGLLMLGLGIAGYLRLRRPN
jgi:ABC-type arginine transport system permease subunit